MKLLALDTSSIACSVALRHDDVVVERHEEQPREHTRLLMPMINEVLGEAGVRADGLDAIVLGNGPGSFIGMRIAASVAQGLAFGAGLDIVPVSSLACVAAEVFTESDAREVIVAQDAHMTEVYLGHYRRGEDGLPEPVGDERLQAVAELNDLDTATAAMRIAAGQGWQRYPELAELNAGFFAGSSEVLYPRARHMLDLGAKHMVAEGAIAAADVAPAYLRQKVAQKPAESP